jgi:beta-glucosidase
VNNRKREHEESHCYFETNEGEVNGIPVHASKQLLTQLLRVQLKFGGMVVTDYQDIIRLHTVHHVAPDLRSVHFISQ